MTGRMTGRRGQTRTRRSVIALYGTNLLCYCLGGRWKQSPSEFSLGIRGSFNEEKWRMDLERLKVPRPAMDKLMHELVARCLVSLGDIYRTRQAALRV